MGSISRGSVHGASNKNIAELKRLAAESPVAFAIEPKTMRLLVRCPVCGRVFSPVKKHTVAVCPSPASCFSLWKSEHPAEAAAKKYPRISERVIRIAEQLQEMQAAPPTRDEIESDKERDRIKRERREREERRREAFFGMGYRQRAVVNGEEINNREVYRRDGYICHICGLATEKDRYHPYPTAPTLDHIIPLRHGGTHTHDNVACAHSMCNIAKNAKMQLSEAKRGELRNRILTHLSLVSAS